jgi:Excalibur calcium-binding domain
MIKLQDIVFVFFAMCMHQALEAATPVYKCLSNGATAFQSDPCTSNARRKEPNINQLNAERMKKRLEDGNLSKSENSSIDGQLSSKPDTASVPLNSVEKNQIKQIAPPASATVSSFKCDGRKYCSQMTSCSEAKFFLHSCPGVKMDGSRGGNGSGNGIPCERQWCNSSLD